MTIMGYGDAVVRMVETCERAFDRLLFVLSSVRPLTNERMQSLKAEIDHRRDLFMMSDNPTLDAIQSVIEDITHQRWKL